MELSVTSSREVSEPDASVGGAETSRAKSPTTASYPALARGSMVARPWEPRPLLALLRRLRRGSARKADVATQAPWQIAAQRQHDEAEGDEYAAGDVIGAQRHVESVIVGAVR